jgi:predicted O-linked N-acetylglucosamine transferase (SPINDLY family)
MAQFDGALIAVSEHPGALAGVAMVLQARHDHTTAVGIFRRALDVAPGNPQALNGLAISLQSLRRHREALAIYRDIVAADPGLAVAHANLGHVLQGLGRQAEAAAAFRRALELKPDIRGIRLFLAYAMLHTCDWRDLETGMGAVLAEAEAGAAVAASPFALAATPASPALRLAVARRAAEACGDSVATEAATLGFMPPRPKDGRLHVGYVSADFRTHSLGLAFREVLRAHDRERFAWHGYSFGAVEDDEVAADYRALFDGFDDFSALTPAEAARRINADGVQVLIDLAGHTKDAWLELFYFRPAPVQAHYLGYAEALGAACIPYLISDPVHVPPALARHMGAKMVYLPESFMATARPAAVPEAPSRAACGLPAEGTVFVSFNAYYKLHPKMFEVWMGLLRDVPDSVLWLRAGDEGAMANLRREAKRAGIAPERLVFAERLDQAGHLSRHIHADVALDTLYHGGGVTSADALWAGVPVVSLAGEAPSSRIGASLLSALDLPELIATSLDDYAAIARELATEPARLAELKARLRVNIEAKPLFDMDRLARHLEGAYERMWSRHTEGKRPAEISVPALPR